MKIADFGLATILDLDVVERLKCGSPGYVAPEILSGQGYGPKVDVFSAGIIFCIILTGVSPFYDNLREKMLQKNREAIVDFSKPCWGFVSKEAKSLASRMVAKDSNERCTALEALRDPWFKLEHSNLVILENAQANMAKYQDRNRFNMGKIKPEFSMVTCTPLLNARFLGHGSPLLIPLDNKPKNGKGPFLESKTPDMEAKPLSKTKDLPMKLALVCNNAVLGKKEDSPAPDVSGDFNDKDIDEKAPLKDCKLREKLAHVPPPTPGFTAKKLLHLKYTSMPASCCRIFSSSMEPRRDEHYLRKIACARLSEEVKSDAMPAIGKSASDSLKAALNAPQKSDKCLQFRTEKDARRKNSAQDEMCNTNGDKQEEKNAGVPLSRIMAVKIIAKRLIESSIESSGAVKSQHFKEEDICVPNRKISFNHKLE
eukprot:TRINITY_DN6627_c0_g5_i1.p1 TRINITY_DN6627_c0_g5~~TRINITY_DN6627_c0_g5_i1.p1  ORF type:complete len:426 (-),score=141.90 TRINITY_DN6627_c0_g5_i1:1126-2403(-)